MNHLKLDYKKIRNLLFVIYQKTIFQRDYIKYLILNRVQPNLKQFSKPRRVLLLTSNGGGNSHGLSYPYFRFAKDLRKKLNLYFFEITSNSLTCKLETMNKFNADIYIISVPVRNQNGHILSKEEVLDFIKSIPVYIRNKTIFFGPTDDPVSPYFDVLPHIRLFLMPFTFSDPTDYDKEFQGASKFADAMSKIYNIDTIPENEYRNELFQSHAQSEYRDKLTISWNFSHWRRLFSMFDKHKDFSKINKIKTIDVNCRFNPYSGWNNKHRIAGVEILEQLSDKYNLAVSSHKIPLDDYFKEIENSKILYSPFGWGAICPKDYEAILKGCLLIKPNIDHINIFPEVLIPYKTYVPVKWDLSDLNEKIEYYLEHEEERNEIIKNAHQVYSEAMSSEHFINHVKSIIEKFDNSELVK